MILGLQQGLKEEGVEVSLVKLCEWFGVARRTVYYRATKGQPKLQEQFVRPIKAMIEEAPFFGYRTVAHLLAFHKNTVQRVPGSSNQVVLTSVRQRFGLHEPPLHSLGQKPWAATGIHHAQWPRAKWNGRAGDPDTQGVVRTPGPL